MHHPAEKMRVYEIGGPVDGHQFSILRKIVNYDYIYVQVVLY